MKFEQPILFHTQTDLKEAIKYKVIDRFYTTAYMENKKRLPVLFWGNEYYENHQSNYNNNNILLDENFQYLYLLKNSINWKEIKDNYKPKWYSLKENINKPIWVRNSEKHNWAVDTFIKFDKLRSYPFQCQLNNWKYAKPVKPEDCIKNN